MINEILNHMTEDELQNWGHHMMDALEASHQLCFAQQELLEAWRRMVNNLEFQSESLMKRNNRMDELRVIEDKMYEKYEQYLPRPVCDGKGRAEQ